MTGCSQANSCRSETFLQLSAPVGERSKEGLELNPIDRINGRGADIERT